MNFSKGRVIADIALAKGKQLHDKRATEKEREWAKEKSKIIKQYNRL
jgi:SsrA-binding protein